MDGQWNADIITPESEADVEIKTNGGLVEGDDGLSVKVDGSTIDINASGELEAIGGGSGSAEVVDVTELNTRFASFTAMVDDIESGNLFVLQNGTGYYYPVENSTSQAKVLFYRTRYLQQGSSGLTLQTDLCELSKATNDTINYNTSSASVSALQSNNVVAPTGNIPQRDIAYGELIASPDATNYIRIYKCIAAYTNTSQYALPYQDTTHWAKTTLGDEIMLRSPLANVLPAWTSADAGAVLRVNSSGTGLEWYKESPAPAGPSAYTLRFQFNDTTLTPSVGSQGNMGTWTEVDASQGIWDWTYQNSDWGGAFDEALDTNGLGVEIIAAGDTSGVTSVSSMFGRTGCNMVAFDTSNVTDFSGMFGSTGNAFAAPLFDTSSATDVSGMFQNCTDCTGGILALYTQMSTQTTPPASHSACFSNAGPAAEAAQIPQDWGGTAT